MEEIKKTSIEWVALSDYIVVEPTGWNQRDFDYYFHEEKITKEQFNERLYNSLTTLKSKKNAK